MAKSKKKNSKASKATSKPKESTPVQEPPHEVVENNVSSIEEELDAHDLHSEVTSASEIPKEGDQQDSTVEELREELNKLKMQLKEKSDVTPQDEQLNKLREERDHFESLYNSLLSRLSSMKSLFSKMKESQMELETTQEQLSEYESQNLALRNKIDSLTRENSDYRSTVVTLNQEVVTLNTECENLSAECSRYKSQADGMQDQLEAAASMHVRDLNEKVQENHALQAQIQELRIVIDNNGHDITSMKDEIQDYQQEITRLQDELGQKHETQAEVEGQIEEITAAHERTMQLLDSEITSLKAALEKTEREIDTSSSENKRLNEQIEAMREDVEAKNKLEQECKERVLQIGKLRHEAIILNEHLTKALALIKHSSSADSVDKELISNLFISFVSIPRGDPKKFEVLELISSFLNWDEDKKTQAGLVNSSNDTSRSRGGRRTDSFVSLWTEYLEKESER